jgi:hypothetical protein
VKAPEAITGDDCSGGTIGAMAADEFVIRVRGADDMRYFRFDGLEARELHGILQQGLLDRPSGQRRLAELIDGREPAWSEPRASTADTDVDWDMVADDELRGYLSRRLMERRGGREIDQSIQAEPEQAPGAGTTL